MKLPSKSTKDYTAKKVVFKTPSASPNRLGLTIKWKTFFSSFFGN